MSAPAYRMRKDRGGKRRRVRTELGHEGYYVLSRTECSNCTDHGEYGTKHGPFGCRDCGYRGYRRVRTFIPFDAEAESYFRALLAEEERLWAP